MEENNQNVLPTEAEAINKSCCGSCDKKSCWEWIFLVVLLFLVASLVYAGYQFSKLSQKQTVVSQVTPVVQPSPIPTSDPTANWKTYNNAKQGVSFKYPLGWNILEKEKGDEVDGRIYNSSIQLLKDESVIGIIFDLVGIGGGPRNVSYEEFLLWDKKYYKQYGNMNFETNTKTVDISDSPTGLGVFKIGTKTYMVSLTYKVTTEGEKPNDQLSKLFDQILSTFKFLE